MTGSIFVPGLLAGRSALVTGGGSGIGFGIATCLSRSGAAVTLASRNAERLEEAARRLAAANARPGGEREARILAVPTNVRDPESLRTAVERTVEAFGSLDILVNNAAGNFYCRSEDLSPNGWRAVVETDLYGTFFGCQAAFPVMREQAYGRIVSTSMTLHYRGWPGMAHATAAKAGVDALTRTLALEWAEHGITVNAVAPGPIPTEGVLRAFSSPPEGTPGLFGKAGRQPEEPAAAPTDSAGDSTAPAIPAGIASAAIPAGRLGRPEDIGNLVTYLVSPAGDWITGAILVVDGGESLARAPGPARRASRETT
ncbi:MAG: SDR family oxidoreductase [Gemmatimonadota bacterium]